MKALLLKSANEVRQDSQGGRILVINTLMVGAKMSCFIASPSWARASISAALCGRKDGPSRHALRRGLALQLARVTLLERVTLRERGGGVLLIRGK